MCFFRERNVHVTHKFISAFKFVSENNEARLLPDLDSLATRSKKFQIVMWKIAFSDGGCKDSLVDIYSLNEETHIGAWSKMYAIWPIDLSPKTSQLSQCFKSGNEILIVAYFGSPFSFYDPKAKRTKVLEHKH